ncbi:MAG TPA: polynucleotide adenylyltransferase PcnB [Alkalispirochaeta sp.]|nr:polynucleotide adenylyltransferase PcnB [Alkalispirochaeta sp.]
MRKRYSRSADGSIVQTAAVYTADEHGINPQDLDHDAVKVVRRLRRHGYDSYIVGGAVRDLLLGKKPKDFDVSTAATPNQIRKLFRNSRIIGKRFRLAHVLFRDKVIEVSTFRSEDAEGFKNIYGTIDEDVRRRDFTANALFLNPEDNTVVDFVGGVRDLRQHVLNPVIPLPRIFREDPVRMIRAVKYAASGGLKIPWKLKRRIKKDHALLGDTPSSRMTEELFKILNSGYAAGIITMLLDLNLYEAVLPEQARLARGNRAYRATFLDRLALLDEKRRERGSLERTDLLVFVAADYLLEYSPLSQERRIPFRDAYYALKEFLSPVTPANREVEGAITEIFRNKGRLLRDEAPEHLDKRSSRRSRPRRRRRRSSPAGGGEPA